MFGAGAAAQLTHPKETSIEEDMRLLTAWSNGVAAATTTAAAAAAEEMKRRGDEGKNGGAMLQTEKDGRGQQQQQQQSVSEDGSGLLPSGRMVAAVQFRLQRKQAVSRSRRAAAGELDALSAASGGWSP
eukprot:COSAG06_NODE_3307_length_5528_cov_105.042918_2_plen_129_part_00